MCAYVLLLCLRVYACLLWFVCLCVVLRVFNCDLVDVFVLFCYGLMVWFRLIVLSGFVCLFVCCFLFVRFSLFLF